MTAATPGQALPADPPFACSSVAVFDGQAFACGGTPGHAGKHRYLIEWDGQGVIAEQQPHAADGVPREPLEALIRAWSGKADEPDRDPYAAAAYRIAKGNLVDAIAAAPQPAPGPADVRTLAGEAIGEASMCWDPRPEGVFESTRAAGIVDRLMEAIGRLAAEPLAVRPSDDVKPAPAQAALARVLSWFGGDHRSTYRTAEVTRAQLANAYKDGELTVPEELQRFL